MCAQCGEELPIGLADRAQVTIHAVSGRPNTRVLSVDGLEVHRCAVAFDRELSPHHILN
jgi:hypothetical protein